MANADTGPQPGTVPAEGQVPAADPDDTVVLLHGWACPVGYWKPLQRRLAGRGHPSIAPPLPGYGQEGQLPAEFDWNVEAVAELLAGEFAAGGRPRPHLVGHSLGGSIAATIAARHPELAASVTLLGMVPTAPSSASAKLLSGLFLDGPISEDAIQLCLNSWYGSHARPGRQLTHAPFAIPRPVLNASLLAALDGVQPDVPGRISAEVQVIVGSGDQTRPLSEVRAFADGHDRTELTVVPGSGHMVHWDAADACAERISAMINR